MKSKRLKITIMCLIINYLIFLLAMFKGFDLVNLSIALVTINGPLLAYVTGESYRPSGTKSKSQSEIGKEEKNPD